MDKESPSRINKKYVAFLRGINVGGHHQLPMAELRQELATLGFEHIITLLNSGNAIFDSRINDTAQLEKMIEERLEATFGFPVPVMVRRAELIQQLYHEAPFQSFQLSKEIRWYASFLKTHTPSDLALPWTSADHSYQIIDHRDQTVLSVLDLSITKTPKAMDALEHFFGTHITTRNWKTIERIIKQLIKVG